MISVRIADTEQGCPAPKIPVDLDYFITGHGWKQVGRGISNDEGCIETFGESAAAGIYRLSFDVAAHAPESFFPSITILFDVRDAGEDCRLHLQVSTFGYSTYRA